jgi:hypothetical protein
LCSCPPMQLLAFLLKTKDHFRVGAFNCWTLLSRIVLKIETNTNLTVYKDMCLICTDIHYKYYMKLLNSGLLKFIDFFFIF